ncbi:sulfurtransferase-like selenium metabolism protein YedF [Anaerosalibacter massiliensis]|uniref:Sulfurtransferase-like selenium metabolism protein YedF n=1 Tax=Anaerosalibacter massiliensis TaxID=1347392 RepID=A0A9X2S5J5_9FIRM|nr:sulfurtransferase-like selenium metabolism protein YedF [Anaerosalibacter massiliensis]MCR2044384.1 sulfurtransferase-like selenium metabolism protein YedF [Anaerosalibacter massiliensis]
MRKEVDARGEACPKPVIMTKKALDGISDGIVLTIVDNEVAKENVSKLAKSSGYEFKVDKKSDSEFYIEITKGEAEEANVCIPDTFKDMTIAISSSTMGNGSEELGKILMKSFIYTLTESIPYPATLVFYNGGVHLTCEGSEVIDDLKKLEEEGVEILSCGTCLDFFEIQDKLKVGGITNMYTILEKLKNPTNTITIS